MKVAIVVDWIMEIGGAEQVLSQICKIYPEAVIYTSQCDKKIKKIYKNQIEVGRLNILPKNLRRFIAPLRQNYFRNLGLSNYDLIISVTGSDAKFVRTGKNTLHLCYCHVPTQYYWGKSEEYLKNPGFGVLNFLVRPIFKVLLPKLRQKDLSASKNPDSFITISKYSQQEIKKYYHRDSIIIHPPVNTELFKNAFKNRDKFLKEFTKISLDPACQNPLNNREMRPIFTPHVENYNTRKGKSQTVENYYNKIKNEKSQTTQNPHYDTKIDKMQMTKNEHKSCSIPQSVENSLNPVRFLVKNKGKISMTDRSISIVQFLIENNLTPGNFYINFSRQVNWKRLDLVVEACVKTGRKLLLIGDGPEQKRLKNITRRILRSNNSLVKSEKNTKKTTTKNPNTNSSPVVFLSSQPQETLAEFVTLAKAFIFPSEEPFGIAPVEALAAGCPVIAYGKGGAKDYIMDGENGMFFHAQTVDSLIKTLDKFEENPHFDKKKISRSAEKFSEENFKNNIRKCINENIK